jgi:hypothetical protein
VNCVKNANKRNYKVRRFGDLGFRRCGIFFLQGRERLHKLSLFKTHYPPFEHSTASFSEPILIDYLD